MEALALAKACPRSEGLGFGAGSSRLHSMLLGPEISSSVLKDIASNLDKVQSSLLDSYVAGPPDLQAAGDFKAARSRAANAVVLLQQELLPASLKNIRNCRSYIENFQYLNFELFEQNAGHILNALSAAQEHANDTCHLFGFYSKDVGKLWRDVMERKCRLEGEANAARQQQHGATFKGWLCRVGGGAGIVAGIAALFATAPPVVSAAAFASPEALGSAVLAGSAGAFGVGEMFMHTARTQQKQDNHCTEVATNINKFLLPALQPLAKVAASLDAFFINHRHELQCNARDVMGAQHVKDEQDRRHELQQVYALMKGRALAMLQLCREYELVTLQAISQLKVIAGVAGRAGDLVPGYAEEWVKNARQEGSRRAPAQQRPMFCQSSAA